MLATSCRCTFELFYQTVGDGARQVKHVRQRRKKKAAEVSSVPDPIRLKQQLYPELLRHIRKLPSPNGCGGAPVRRRRTRRTAAGDDLSGFVRGKLATTPTFLVDAPVDRRM